MGFWKACLAHGQGRLWDQELQCSTQGAEGDNGCVFRLLKDSQGAVILGVGPTQ